MDCKFNSEKDLISSFLYNYKIFKNEIVVEEISIRFGNIDIVSIENVELPFSNKQIKVLSKPAGALVFTKIKNKRPISKERLLKSIGLSESTLDNILYELLHCELIYREGNNYYRTIQFEFPKTIVTGYEAKLRDFNKAFFQAKGNKQYTDYSYIVFPMDMARVIMEKKINLLKENGIGLIGVSKEKSKCFLKATKSDMMQNHIRLLNLAKVNLIISYS